MEAESPSEISIAFYRSMRRHIPGQLDIHQQHRETFMFGGTRRDVWSPQQRPARLGSLSCDCVPGRQACSSVL